MNNMTNYFVLFFILVMSAQLVTDAIARRMRHYDYEYWKKIGEPLSNRKLVGVIKSLREVYSAETLNFCKKYKFQYLLYYLWISTPIAYVLLVIMFYQILSHIPFNL